MSARLASAALVAALTVAGCGPMAPAPGAGGMPSREAAPLYRIEQIQFGQEARYAMCLDGTCPARTAKTRVSAMADPAPAPVPRTQRVSVFLPSGRSTLTPSARAALREAVAMARQAKAIAIVGYTDNTGHERANAALALARAKAVGQYLRRQVPEAASRMEVTSAGACCFVASNDTDDGRARNRRVEIVFRSAG